MTTMIELKISHEEYIAYNLDSLENRIDRVLSLSHTSGNPLDKRELKRLRAELYTMADDISEYLGIDNKSDEVVKNLAGLMKERKLNV